MLPNGVDAAVAIYGVLRAGAAFSPVNPSTKRDRLALQLADLGASAVLCAEPLTATVRAAAADAVAVAGVSDLERMGAQEPPTPGPLEIDLGAVIYTSGSTGEPKGVTLSHRNMTFVADSIIDYLGLDPDDRILCVLPLSFNYGLYQLLMAVRVGATLVLEPGFAFPGRIVSLLIDERITCLPGVPTVFTTLLSLHGLRERELPGPPLADERRRRPARGDRRRRAGDLPGRRSVSDVWADRGHAGRLPATGPRRLQADRGRDRDPGHRGLDRGRERGGCSGRGRSVSCSCAART